MGRREYISVVSDSRRWDDFVFRDGDIVIATPAKCGTTWTQYLTAQLIFGSGALPAPLDRLSPWLDMRTTALDVVLEELAAQTHRRFIKTHTPLDGLPIDPRATYVCVGRDPRDVAMSWEHHMANLSVDSFVEAFVAAEGLEALMNATPQVDERPEDPGDRFVAWVEADGLPGTTDGLGSLAEHLAGFWAMRDEPNVELFHYRDLSTDLPGQIRRLATTLGVAVSDDEVAAIAAASTFDAMKAGADTLVPDARHSLWQSNQAFFHKGTSGQWRDIVTAEGLQRYAERLSELAPPDLVSWMHDGWGAGSPAGEPT